MTVRVRPAEARDVPALVRLNRMVQALHAEAEPEVFRTADDLPGLDAFHRTAVESEGRHAFVAEIEGEVVGYVTAWLQEREAHTFARARRHLHVDQVGVDPAARRRGVGRALMARVDALAEELAVGEVTLDTWAFNEEARRFFEGLGFGVYNLRFRKGPSHPA